MTSSPQVNDQVKQEIETSQDVQHEYEIVGLPFSSCLLVPVPIPIFGLGKRVTLIKYDRVTVTTTHLLTSAYPVQNHQDRVTLSIAGCFPSDLPAYPPCD